MLDVVARLREYQISSVEEAKEILFSTNDRQVVHEMNQLVDMMGKLTEEELLEVAEIL